MRPRSERATRSPDGLLAGLRECDPWVAGPVVLVTAALVVGVVDAKLAQEGWFPLVPVVACGAIGLVAAVRGHVLAAIIAVVLATIEVVDPAPKATWVVAGGLLFLFALKRPRLDAVAAGVALAAAGVAIDEPWLTGGLDVGAYGIITLAAAMVGVAQWVQAQRRYVAAEIGRRREESERRRVQVEQRLAEERLRIARDLHDSVAHHIAVVNVQTNLARASLPVSVDTADQALQHVQAAAREVLADLQQVLGVLRGSTGDRPALAEGVDGVPADFVREFTHRYESMGLAVETSGLDLFLGLPPDVQTALWRVLQEALTNAYRYGDGAVAVHLGRGDDDVTLLVRNRVGPAAGPRNRPGGHGLIGMSERVGGLGGELSARAEGEEFVIRARVPRAATTSPAPAAEGVVR